MYHSKIIFKKHITLLKKYLIPLDIKELQKNKNIYHNGSFLITMDDGYHIENSFLEKNDIKPIIFINYESLKRNFNYAQFIYYKYGKSDYCFKNLKINKNEIKSKKNVFLNTVKCNSNYFYISDHGFFHFNYKFLNKLNIKRFSNYFKKKFINYKNYLPFFAIPFGRRYHHYDSNTLINLKNNYDLIFLNSNLFNKDIDYKKKLLIDLVFQNKLIQKKNLFLI